MKETQIADSNFVDAENTHNAIMQNTHALTLAFYTDEVKSIKIKNAGSAVILTTNFKIFN